MPRGGRRPGAGRKTNAELSTIRTVIDETIKNDDWQTLVNNLFALAKKGNVRATQLLFTYRFGDPYSTPENEGDPVSFVNVMQPCTRQHVHPDYDDSTIPDLTAQTPSAP